MALNENIVIRLMADTSNYTTKMQAASAQAETMAKAMEKPMTTGQRMEAGFTKAGLAVGALSAAIGVAAVKSFMDFDASMSMVQANTGASGKEMNKLRDAALEAGSRTVYSATESADAINELAKAGMSTSDVLNGGLNGALDLAASDGMAVSEAAELMSSTLSQFNLTGKDATKVADALAAGAGKAQGDAKDLGYALGQSGMVAHSFGISMEETTGTLASFAHAGMIGSDAGTSLKSMLIALANPSKKAQQTMDDLGISAYDAQGNFVGLDGLAGQLQESMKHLTVQQRNQALATIFGSDAVRAANVLYKEGAKGIDGWTKAVSDSGYASKQAAARNDNLKGDIEQLSGAVETMLIKIGSGANGPFRSMVQNVTNVINAFGSLDPQVQQTTVLLGMGAGAAAGLHKMFGNLSTSSSGLSRNMGLVLDPVQRLQTAAPQLSTGLSMLTSAFRGPEQGVGLMANGLTRGQTAMSGLKSVGGGLMSMLGGPWGIALTGASIAVGILAQSQHDAQQRANDYADALDKGTDAAVKLQKNIATGNNISWSWWDKQQTGADGFAKALDNAGISARTFAQAAAGNKIALAQYNDQMDKLKLGSSDQVTLGQHVAGVFNEQKKAIDDSRVSAKAQAEAEKEETKQKVANTMATATGTSATKQDTSATQDSADAKDILAEKMGATTRGVNAEADALGQVIEALKIYYGLSTGASNAEINLHAAFDAGTKALAENGAGLDLNTEKGQNNRRALNDIADKAFAAAEAEAKNGKTLDEINPIIDDARNRLIQLAQKMGMSADEAKNLADSSGISRDAVNKLTQAVNNVPTQHNTNLTVTDNASRTLRTIRNDVVTLPDNKVIRVTTNYTSTGEHVASNGSGGTLVKASGGYISGPGTSTSDSIPARLSNGEYVLNASAVKAIGIGTLDALNYQRYASGGLVRKYEATSLPTKFDSGQGKVTYLQTVNLKMYGTGSSSVDAQLAANKIRSSSNALLAMNGMRL